MRRYIACLKYGKKYSANYVNILKRMTSRHLSIPFKFLCFTEDSTGLDPDIETISLPPMGLDGPTKAWWYKLKMFDPSLGLEGTLLFLDLDVVILKDIDKLFEYKPQKFCIIQDFLRVRDPNYKIKNSSVFRLELGSYSHVWEDFISFKDQITAGFHGDQDWISAKISDAEIWPHDWVISYRWELKHRLDRDSSKHKSYHEETTPPQECSILVFHGEPNPSDVTNCFQPDPLIARHWC